MASRFRATLIPGSPLVEGCIIVFDPVQLWPAGEWYDEFGGSRFATELMPLFLLLLGVFGSGNCADKAAFDDNQVQATARDQVFRAVWDNPVLRGKGLRQKSALGQRGRL